MADLYNDAVGVNTRKSLTTEDRSGPFLTWLVVDNNDSNYEPGSSYDPELTTKNSKNFQVLQAIQQYCEVYEVVRPSTGILSIQVRTSSVPYSDGEEPNDGGENSVLTTAVRAALSSNNYTVWNGAFQDDDINWD